MYKTNVLRTLRCLALGSALAMGGLGATGCSLLTEFEACTQDDQCAAGFACRAGLCRDTSVRNAQVLLESEFCHSIYPSNAAELLGTEDEPLLIGTLLPITGSLASRGPSRERAVYMAIDEINQTGGGSGGVVLRRSPVTLGRTLTARRKRSRLWPTLEGSPRWSAAPPAA